MIKIIRTLCVCLVAVAMTSCYSTRQVTMVDDYERACTGLTKDVATTQFGEPIRTYQSDKGEVFVYESYEGEQTVANRKYLELIFDEQGVCRGVITNYTKPERYLDEKKSKRVLWGTIAGVGVGTVSLYTLIEILSWGIGRGGAWGK